MVATLVAAKAKKVANHLNQYPIHMAIESGKTECVKLLEGTF
jgi:ankyrin repeat protein